MKAWPLICALAALAGCQLFYLDELRCTDDAHCPETAHCGADDRCAPGPAEPPPPLDAGLDSGDPDDVDAGPPDAGPLDAGPLDAGPLDAGPAVDAGPSGCEEHIEPLLPVRHDLELTSLTPREIPAGYPLRLDLSGFAPLGDLRLYRCDGAIQQPVPLAEPRAGDRPYFRALEAITGSDDNYILYSGGLLGGDPPSPGVPDARVVDFQQPAPTPISTTEVTVVDLALPQASADERWLLIGNWTMTNTSTAFRPLSAKLILDDETVFNGRLGVQQLRTTPRLGAIFVVAPGGTGRVRLTLRALTTGDACDLEDVHFQAALIHAPPLLERAGSGDVSVPLPAEPGVLIAGQRLAIDDGFSNASAHIEVQLASAPAVSEVAEIDYGIEPSSRTAEPLQPQLWASALEPTAGDEVRFRVNEDGTAEHELVFIGLVGNFDAFGSPPTSDRVDVATDVGTIPSSYLAAGLSQPHERLFIATASMGRSVAGGSLQTIGETHVRLNSVTQRREIVSTREDTEAYRAVAWSGALDTAELMQLEFFVRREGGTTPVLFFGGSFVEIRYFEVAVSATQVSP